MSRKVFKLDKKEFSQFQLDIDHKPPMANISDDFSDELGNTLILSNYQKLISALMHPSGDIERILLMHSTGVGKTITSLATALREFHASKRNVFVLGFSQSVFKKELFNRPEFGILDYSEVEELSIARETSRVSSDKSGNSYKDAIRRANSKLNHLANPGIYFIGYRGLVNKLFIKVRPSFQMDTLTTNGAILDALSSGNITYNKSFVERFDGSYVICDEVHNLYNSSDMNTWGIALKHLLDNTHCKVMYLSATPVNNSPKKIVSVANLMVRDFIPVQDIFTPKGELKPDALEKLESVFKGRVSYIIDRSGDNYPELIMHGVPLEKDEYLKFTKCHISKLHANTIKSLDTNQVKNLIQINVKDEVEVEDDVDQLVADLGMDQTPLEGGLRYLNDAVFPSMENPDVGIYTKKEVIRQFMGDVGYDRYGIKVQRGKSSGGCSITIQGPILEKNNLRPYSEKYFQFLSLLEKAKGKIFVFHNFVQMTGICLLQDILKQNDWISMEESPGANTKCAKCYKSYASHADTSCTYAPCRFATITGYTAKNTLDANIDIFNSKDNSDGSKCKLILGSKAVRESFDFKAIQHMIVLHQPDNISTLLQVIGRAVRKGSHLSLPLADRKVNLHILVSAYKEGLSFEERKWMYKIQMYKMVQKMNLLLMESSVDYDINYDANTRSMSTGNLKLYKLDPTRPRRILQRKQTASFEAFFYGEEVAHASYLIKRMFIERSPVWGVDSLWKAVQNPHWQINRDHRAISKASYNAALYKLMYKKSNILRMDASQRNVFISDIVPTMSSDFIYIKGQAYKIRKIKHIFVLVRPDGELKLTPIIPYSIENQSVRYIDITNANVENKDRLLEIAWESSFNKYKNTSIELMEPFIEGNGHDFHNMAINKVVRYAYEFRTTGKSKKDHGFMIKLLYLYNKFECIVWGNSPNQHVQKMYAGRKRKTGLPTSTSDPSKPEAYNLVHSLMQEELDLAKNPAIRFKIYYKYLEDWKQGGEPKPKDVLLPVGYIYDTTTYIMDPETLEFVSMPTISPSSIVWENADIIGYYEKDRAGAGMTFKIHTKSDQNESQRDKRKITTGVTCLNMATDANQEIMDMLDIRMGNAKKKVTCQAIKIKLIEMDLRERRIGSYKRYFYFHWEPRDEYRRLYR